MELLRCKICGEVYFGKHPSHCPHCGAHAVYMISIRDWKDENKGFSVSELSKKNLLETKELEYTATRFYRAAAKITKNEEIKGFFKYLARTEKEHYEVACKILGDEILDSINEPSEALETDKENLLESKKKEEHATEVYTRFMNEAIEPRIKDFFKAVAEVEADHIELDNKELKKF